MKRPTEVRDRSCNRLNCYHAIVGHHRLLMSLMSIASLRPGGNIRKLKSGNERQSVVTVITSQLTLSSSYFQQQSRYTNNEFKKNAKCIIHCIS